MKPLPPNEWDPSLQHIIDDMNGRPIHMHCLLANHPDLLNAWWTYRMHSVQGGDLEQRDCELVILRVAVHMENWYEWAAHVDRGLMAGLTLEETYQVADGPSADGWNKQDAALLESVDQLIENHRIDVETQSVLGNYYSAKQVMDIVSLQGMYVTVACMIGTWGIDIEDYIAQRLPGEITEQSFRKLISAANRN